MSTEALKAAAITSLDSTPPVRTTNYGQRRQTLFAAVTGTTAADNGSTYRMARLPSSASLHGLDIWLDASVTTFTADITLYYSDATSDGTSPGLSGAVAAHVYKTAVALASVTSPTDYYAVGNITGTGHGKQLWQDAGLSVDPEVMFDIVLLTTTTTSGAPVINARINFGNN